MDIGLLLRPEDPHASTRPDSGPDDPDASPRPDSGPILPELLESHNADHPGHVSLHQYQHNADGSLQAVDSEAPSKRKPWNKDEDELVIRRRRMGWTWNSIADELPGRSDDACRLRYQNHLNKGKELEQQRNDMSRIYRRDRPEIWAKTAAEMKISWEAVEALFWQMGYQDIMSRAEQESGTKKRKRE